MTAIAGTRGGRPRGGQGMKSGQTQPLDSPLQVLGATEEVRFFLRKGVATQTLANC